jgi:hypothetical protein
MEVLVAVLPEVLVIVTQVEQEIHHQQVHLKVNLEVIVLLLQMVHLMLLLVVVAVLLLLENKVVFLVDLLVQVAEVTAEMVLVH